MRGETPGLVPNESVELVFRDTGAFGVPFELEDGRGYTIEVTAILRGISTTNTPLVLSIQQLFSVRRDGGVTTIAGAGTQEVIGDGDLPWTLTASVRAAPDRFALVASTGGMQTRLRVVSKVEFTEVFNPVIPIIL